MAASPGAGGWGRSTHPRDDRRPISGTLEGVPVSAREPSKTARFGALFALLAGCGESFTYLSPPAVEGEPGVLLAVEGEDGAVYHGSAGWPSAPTWFTRELASCV